MILLFWKVWAFPFATVEWQPPFCPSVRANCVIGSPHSRAGKIKAASGIPDHPLCTAGLGCFILRLMTVSPDAWCFCFCISLPVSNMHSHFETGSREMSKAYPGKIAETEEHAKTIYIYIIYMRFRVPLLCPCCFCNRSTRFSNFAAGLTWKQHQISTENRLNRWKWTTELEVKVRVAASGKWRQKRLT